MSFAAPPAIWLRHVCVTGQVCLPLWCTKSMAYCLSMTTRSTLLVACHQYVPTHVGSLQTGMPADLITMAKISESLSPHAAIRTYSSQSPLWGADAAKNRTICSESWMDQSTAEWEDKIPGLSENDCLLRIVPSGSVPKSFCQLVRCDAATE